MPDSTIVSVQPIKTIKQGEPVTYLVTEEFPPVAAIQNQFPVTDKQVADTLAYAQAQIDLAVAKLAVATLEGNTNDAGEAQRDMDRWKKELDRTSAIQKMLPSAADPAPAPDPVVLAK